MSAPHHERLTILATGQRVLFLAGELDLANAAELRERLRTLEREDLMVDLSGVAFMDSTGLAALLQARLAAQRHGALLRVRGSNCQTRELLERTGVLALLSGEARAA